MTFIEIIFYLFATVSVASGLMVIVSPNPVNGALWLVLTFFAMSGTWMLLQAEFLALILVLVYVGAVMTLFLFVVMMLQVNVVSMRKGLVRYFPIGALVVFTVTSLCILVIGPQHFGLANMPAPPLKPADYNNIASLGNILYTDFVFPFELAAIILLTAMVAAISLTHRKPRGRKAQVVSEQIAVKRADRLRVMKVASAKKKILGEGHL